MLRHPRNPARWYPARPCWSGTGRRHESGCLPERSCRTGHRSDTRLLPSLSRVTPSAISEHCSELIGCPISRSLTTCRVGLELRSLPSAGITRLQRYYEPLRHPNAPGLSLAGVRLAIPGHAMELPVLRTPSLCACRRHYPGAADGRTHRSKSPIRISLPRSHFRVGPHIVLFEACSAFTRVAACTLARSPNSWPLSEGFRHFVTSMPAPVASGWSDCRAGLAPAGEAPPCHGARGEQTFGQGTAEGPLLDCRSLRVGPKRSPGLSRCRGPTFRCDETGGTHA